MIRWFLFLPGQSTENIVYSDDFYFTELKFSFSAPLFCFMLLLLLFITPGVSIEVVKTAREGERERKE
jgi:hypothetical protein